ncbi:MAG: tetratricopeptide repeat protein [Candidatus Kariarchaeaceae archaeon]|jgi:tetratricopeptide (TPR) repeat protein
MPRFSENAKEVMASVYYHTDIVKANKLREELKDPLDIAFGKVFVAFFYVMYHHQSNLQELLVEIKNDNKRLKDPLIQLMIDFHYCWINLGVNYPVVSKEQAEQYLDNIEQSYQDIDYIDDWEKNFCFGFYHHTKAVYECLIRNDLSNAIKHHKRCIEFFSKIPEDGEYVADMSHLNLGVYYQQNGDFKEAEKSFNRVLEVSKKFNNLSQYWALSSLSGLNFLKGNLQKALELNVQRLNISRESDNTYGIFTSLTRNASYLFQESNYDDAIKAHRESLVYRKQHGEALPTFWGYFNIFKFYYQRFKTSKDKAFLEQAEQTLTDLEEMRESQSDNKTIIRYTNYAHSLILKEGNILKKAKSIGIMQDLLKDYPNNIEISLNLLELLFDDAAQSEDQDMINQIDTLMEKLGEIPLRTNPQAVFNFVSQQIFLAKFNYYIKGDPSLALDILNDAKVRINTYRLDNLVDELDAEIQVLEKELTKWDNLDISVRNRIKTSEFSKYIQQALSIADKQM